MRDVVAIKLGGEDYQLPVTFAAYEAVDRLGLCPYKLFTTAAVRLQVPGLSVPQAAMLLAQAIGPELSGKALHAKAGDLWKAAKGRDLGCKELVDEALKYLGAILTDMEDAEAKPAPEDVNRPKP
jgi:hypothetical protein